MDDLSFEEFEIEYKFLKAVIEGGVETKPENILIYATSNRRHLIKETWNDRDDMESSNGLHRSDTMEEKLSLVNRFGCQICYSKPTRSKHNFVHIVNCHKFNAAVRIIADSECFVKTKLADTKFFIKFGHDILKFLITLRKRM